VLHLPVSGERIGRYELVAKLGQGGMGTVYSAVDTELDRRVALKFLSTAALGTQPRVDRFIREAKIASALNHPNIVTVHEVLRSEDKIAIAMELVDGRSLREVCKSSLPLPTVLRIGQQIAQAIAVAHGRNIVHADLKPENIMVRSDGYV